MKYLVLTLGLALGCGLALAEQGASGQAGLPGGPGGPPPWMNEVGLTDEQREEMRKIQAAGGGREEIRAVLTPEQQQKIREMRGAHKGPGQEGPGRGSIEQLQRRLDLSDEQVAEMEKIRAGGGTRQDMMEVLTPQQQEQIRAHKGPRKGRDAPGGPARETPPG